jgi:MFS superfamily sulfate permease-like transporter
MKLVILIAIVLGLLLFWRRAWRTQPMLAYGITIGIMISWVFAVLIGRPSFDHVPLWLPPLPFAVVAVTLLIFGVLAWVWDDGQPGSDQSGETGPPPSH